MVSTVDAVDPFLGILTTADLVQDRTFQVGNSWVYHNPTVDR